MKRYTVELDQFFTVYAEDSHSAMEQFRSMYADGLLEPDGTITQCEEDGLRLDLDGTEVESLRGLLAEQLEGSEDTHTLHAVLQSLYGEDD